jgi:hypothetical protein
VKERSIRDNINNDNVSIKGLLHVKEIVFIDELAKAQQDPTHPHMKNI